MFVIFFLLIPSLISLAFIDARINVLAYLGLRNLREDLGGPLLREGLGGPLLREVTGSPLLWKVSGGPLHAICHDVGVSWGRRLGDPLLLDGGDRGGGRRGSSTLLTTSKSEI